MSLLCKTIGHKWKGIITGFNYEGNPIGRCARCDMPIVDPNQQAAAAIYSLYKQALELEEQGVIEVKNAE